jgi:hypothetical protein
MKKIKYINGNTAASGLLIAEMLARVFDEDIEASEDVRAVLFFGAKRIGILTNIAQFAIAGLIVSNALWFAHWMGWF